MLWARVADEDRLLVWVTKVLVVTRLPRPSLHPLLSTHWTLANMNVMVVNAETDHMPHSSPRCGVFVHLPYTVSGMAETVRVASWTPTQGLNILSTQLTLYPEKGANFHGAPVTLGANTLPPYWQQWEVLNSEGGKEMRYAGRSWLMIELVAHKLNFTPVQVLTNNWAEVMALIKERAIYISPVVYTVMPHQLAFNDYTTFIEPDTLTFSMAVPSLAPRWQALYYPLSPVVWFLVLLSILVYPAVLLLLSYNRSEGGLRVMVVMEATATLLGQPLPRHLPYHTSLRLLVGAWLVFGVIFATAYRGNLTAFLTIPKFPPRAETLHQLIMTDAMVTVPWDDGDDLKVFFGESGSPDTQELSRRMYKVWDTETGMRQATYMNEAYVYIRKVLEMTIAQHFTSHDGQPQLYVAQENISPGIAAWPIIRDAFFKHTLDWCVNALVESGLSEKWMSDTLDIARRDSRILRRQEQEASENTPSTDVARRVAPALTMTHMQGLFFLLLPGFLLGTVSFVVEFLMGKVVVG
ncbi:hypothetical protein Pcinc_003269 [Petrolisthes cinctipes]|uniref:Ionotropic glutamate receptor C-terminal domain-containing protein n=1 Tax=Petrolisthes cinctipes TaxID=88211 RepID=A0AAE1GGN1_PETCI|nr:hypothetical protein Pcinc_003269 [Petrolisthes cinctipes]